jgi:hypothetical protein
MDFLNKIKILYAPYISLFAIVLYLINGEDIYLFLAGSILAIFSCTVLLLLGFILFKFGWDSIIESEIEAMPWLIYFLAILIYIYLNLAFL